MSWPRAQRPLQGFAGAAVLSRVRHWWLLLPPACNTQLLGQLQPALLDRPWLHIQQPLRFTTTLHFAQPTPAAPTSSSKMAPSMLSFLACLLLAMASGCQAQASASAFASVSTVCACAEAASLLTADCLPGAFLGCGMKYI